VIIPDFDVFKIGLSFSIRLLRFAISLFGGPLFLADENLFSLFFHGGFAGEVFHFPMLPRGQALISVYTLGGQALISV